jgi:hypothetical protein
MLACNILKERDGGVAAAKWVWLITEDCRLLAGANKQHN